ncbi:DUF2778 domain-containing protein [Rhodoblastus acidophilus]|uniref:tlde1 domain-containing protein n=1 Tax=Candidatus Rhodoblastus alkanivorans TaxID=2954117 RepID=UPI001FAA4953|nr:DUF2778 domain-containing protein [Candidatus Rhodoblastus alkanivorans]
MSLPRKVFVRAVPAFAAFSFSAAVALRLAGGLAGQAAAPAPERVAANAPAAPENVAIPHVDLASGPTKPNLDNARNPFGGLFDPQGETRGMPALEARTDPIGPSFSPLQAQPLFTMVEAPDAGTDVADARTDQQSVAQQTAAAQLDSADDVEHTPLKPALPPVQTAEVEQTDAQVQSSAQAEIAAPLPPARPPQLAALVRSAEEAAPRRESPSAPSRAAAAAATARERAQATTFARNDPRSFFDNIFDKHNDQQRKGPQLAYASPDAGGGGLFNLSHLLPSSPAPVTASGGTAVYDISAHTVYLPDGRKLEAHSGLGAFFDDPNHVHVRMRGSTPPAVYKLSLRESLFHGVRALRLTPVDGNVYGRNGLLAHTFMLGARGDSNGCVSFRNYRAFLDAYMRGEVRELKVVASR